MTDTLWADISSWQVPVDDSYPYQVLAIRSNDGDYRDPHFAQNYAWGLNALATGRLRVLIVYFVWRQNWQVTIDTHKAMLGAPHDGVVSMIDVESWGGKITGDQSTLINASFFALAGWYGDPARVIGYGNVGDLNALWPTKPPNLRLVVAAYGHNPSYPGKFAHQFTNGQTSDAIAVPPFGKIDVNSADGLSVDQVAALLGVAPAPAPVPAPVGATDPVWLSPIPDYYGGGGAPPIPRADVALGWGITHAANARDAAAGARADIAALLAKVDDLSSKLDELLAAQKGDTA